MAKKKLTAAGIAHLEPGEYWDELLGGFHVRVSPKGRRTFAVRYRDTDGAQRRLKLGVFDADRYTLAMARAEAKDVLLNGGPIDEPEPEPTLTPAFESEARRVLKRRTGVKGLRAATVKERTRIIESFLIPAWGDRPVDEIGRSDVKELRDSLAETPVQANRVVSLVSLVFNELLDDELVSANPAHRIDRLAEPKRAVWLERDQIGKVWCALGDEGPVQCGALRFAMLTAQRIGSIRAMRWEQIRGTTWRIPAKSFKGKREHWVPLSDLAREVLEPLREFGSEWVFPSLRSDSQTGHLGQTDSTVKRVSRETGIDFRAHDFRATFRTLSTRPVESRDPDIPSGCGVTPETADAILGHAENTVGLTHYQGRPEEHRLADKRDALEKWGAFVRAVVEADA